MAEMAHPPRLTFMYICSCNLSLQTLTIMTRQSYTVRYRVESAGSATNSMATVMLYSPSESEAIAALKARGTVGRDKNIIILSISRN